MSEKSVEEKLDNIIQFKKKNIKVLKEWKNFINEAKDEIFNVYCLKTNLKECEPWSCSFRMTNICQYPQELSKLEKITRIE
ncbi:hypothetical protein JXQ31_17420 [candidate division KSB1 bacterium]|nr:hypothetical protein [candidate division KSB1 bacterium]